MLVFGVLTLVLFMSITLSGCMSDSKDPVVQVTKPAGKDWRLTLNGTSEKVLTLDDLRRFPVVTVTAMRCPQPAYGSVPISVPGWTSGILLPMRGELNPKDQVWISAPDGYLWVFDADQLAGNGFVTFNTDLKETPSPRLRIILMYEQDTKPVSYDEGGPARIAIVSDEPGVITEGSAWVKWVNRIDIHRK